MHYEPYAMTYIKKKLTDQPLQFYTETIFDSHKSHTETPMKSKTTRTPLILPGLYPAPLLFIGQLCGDGYQSIFDTEKFTITKNGQAIISG